MSQTKVELAAELLGTALENDAEGRESFKSILAVTIQDELDRGADAIGSIVLTDTQIIEISQRIAEDFTLTLENQNDKE